MHKNSRDETNSNLMEHKNVKNPDLNMKHSNNIEHGTTTKNSLCSICGEEFTQVRMIFIMKSCSILKKTKAAWIEHIDITKLLIMIDILTDTKFEISYKQSSCRPWIV